MYCGCRFVCAWLYYGVVLLTTTLLQYDPHCGRLICHYMCTTEVICILYKCCSGIDLVSDMNCTETELTADEYLKILWTSAAELPGVYA